MAPEIIYYIIIAAVAAVTGALLGVLVYKMLAGKGLSAAKQRAKDVLEEAEKQAGRVRKEAEIAAKEQAYKMKEEFEAEAESRRRELRTLEKRLSKREDVLDQKIDIFNKKEKEIEKTRQEVEQKERGLTAKEQEINQLYEQEKEELSRIGGLSRQEARDMLLEKIASEVEEDAGRLIARRIEAAREEADRKARNIIGLAIQRCAADHTIETAVASIDIPSDDMKGRIIGREGRNIRAFEKATGVDVIVDDTPGVIVISVFDSVRREIARRSMEKLILDGRIHPARIEEVVAESKKEVDELIKETGREACYEFGLHNVHPKEVLLLGRLRFRTSYGQNVLQHSKEVAYINAGLAGELNLSVDMAKRCGLLHDIGKAVDHEVEGTHPAIGADIARRCKEKPEIVDAIAAHHGDVEPKTLYAVITQASDAISAARPGARRETLDRYIKRLERLEEVANGFPGIQASFAIQAGREIRVIVNADKVADVQANKLCYDIAKQIEQELSYPGEIKVTLIRETRVIEYAR